MRLSRRRPPEDAPEGAAAASDGPEPLPPGPAAGAHPATAVLGSGPNGSHPAELVASLVVEDELESRIRLPTDLLRCVTAGIEIALLVGIALLGKATAIAVEDDIVAASNHLGHALIGTLHSLAFASLLVLPVVLAIRLVVISELRRLAEAVVIGLIAAGITAACNAILSLAALGDLYHALAHAGNALDESLAGLVAYLTVIGMTGQPRWRTWFGLAITFYFVTSLVEKHATILSLLITLLLGSAVGSGLRYLTGTNTERPTAAEIAAALSAAAVPLVEIRRLSNSRTENRRYAARSRDGARLDVTVFDRDQQGADAFYRIYRRLRLTSQVSRSAPLTVSRAVERRALMTYAVEDAGVSTPRLEAAVRVAPEAAAIATHHLDGTTLAKLAGPPSDEQLSRVWDAVLELHRRRVTHRSLTPRHIQLSGDGGMQVALLEPGDGDVAASDLQIRLDLAQLTVTMALVVGPERSAALARRKLGSAAVASLVPLLQPVVLHRTTRAELRRHTDVLPSLRKRFVASSPDAEVPPEQLERIRPRGVITLVAAVFAAYILIGEFNQQNFASVLSHSEWRWVLVAVALSALTYVAAAFSLTGFVLEKLRFVTTVLVQLAGNFVTLVTPAAVGGVALNIRYLHKAKVAPADAASSVGVSQVFAFALHLLLLIIFVVLTGGSPSKSIAPHPPSWSYIALAVVVALALAVLALPAGRRLVRSRVAPALGQVIPRLLDIAQRPAKLAEGIGGALALTLSYIVCMYVCVLAVGQHAQFFAVGVVFLAGSAIASVVPTPGGIGIAETALSGLLGAVEHVPAAQALSAVLLFRLITFYVPAGLGWLALNYLQRREVL
ncbi:MAG TPA: lysylphosphatidylglycerol synthase transmembrane domain-containing protein [Streptosporangiaceae bacterium]|nr:lysylphosphatidylglycerol synthase transmembrane domain-containing protein [Streptosporangiaceae bacterium]